MPDVSDIYPSRFLKSADLKGRSARVTIATAQVEELNNKSKVVLTFVGRDKSLVLNKSNAIILADAWGGRTEGWVGKELEISPTRTLFQGTMVDTIRVAAVAPALPIGGGTNDMDDTIPF
jgi:hypothetical protein